MLDNLGKIIVDFLSEKSLPETMQYISMVLLTVMIPLGIALLDNRDDKILERYVFLDHIVNMRIFAWALAGLTGPLLLWRWVGSFSDVAWRNATWCVLFSSWLFAIFFVAKSFGQIYGWLKKKEVKEYLRYLESIGNKEDMLVAWGEVWKRKKENWSNEKQFFSIFSKKIDKVMESDIRFARELLQIFEQFIQERNLFLVAGHPEVLPKILEWHHAAWNLEYGFLIRDEEGGSKGSSLYGSYGDLSQVLDSIIRKIEERALLEGGAHGFFNHLEKHVEKYGNEKKTKDREYYYAEALDLQNCFFENVNRSKEVYDIKKRYFPAKWKIAYENLDNKEPASYIWSSRFMDWLNDRINTSQERYDDQINKAVEILFPRVHMLYFPYVLAFILRSWIGESRMEALIDNPPRFGGYYDYRDINISGMNDEELDKEREKDWNDAKKYTVKLSVRLFSLYFRGLERYIEELRGLEMKYKNDKKKEGARKELLDIFGMINGEIQNK
jgi:hypothetical protein